MDSIKAIQQKCSVFNKLHPIGSKVVCIGDLGEEVETTVKHSAEVLSGHTPVIWLEGFRGCYHLDRVIG